MGAEYMGILELPGDLSTRLLKITFYF